MVAFCNKISILLNRHDMTEILLKVALNTINQTILLNVRRGPNCALYKDIDLVLTKETSMRFLEIKICRSNR